MTTEVIGVDGNSYAPFKRREDLRDFVAMYAGLDGHPPIGYDWDTVASYLTRFDRKVAVNISFLIGNSALRISALGWDDIEADEAGIARMRSMLREGMEEGAFGVSTGLDYPPGAYATTSELISLTTEAAKLGGFYHTHVRYRLGDRYLDPFREAVEIGRRGGSPVHITHFYRRAAYPGAGPMLDLVEAARAEGLDITFDTYPYEWSSTTLLIRLPLWVQAGGPSRLKERLRDSKVRGRLREELDATAWSSIRVGSFRQPDYRRFEGWILADVLNEIGRGNDATATFCDLLLAEDLGINEVAPGPYGPALPKFVAHELAMVGSDSIFLGEYPSPRTYGTFPRILGEFVRDERFLSLPEAVRKMTALPAQRLGLPDRGLLRDGMAADIVVFDPVRVRALATYEDPRQYPTGIIHVVVNGQLVIDGERPTGALPGRALRRGRPSSGAL